MVYQYRRMLKRSFEDRCIPVKETKAQCEKNGYVLVVIVINVTPQEVNQMGHRKIYSLGAFEAYPIQTVIQNLSLPRQ